MVIVDTCRVVLARSKAASTAGVTIFEALIFEDAVRKVVIMQERALRLLMVERLVYKRVVCWDGCFGEGFFST